MLRLIPTNVQPPDGYRFVVPRDGVPIIANSYEGWLEKIKKHFADNVYELPADWIAQAEEQLCRFLPPGWCRYDDGSAPTAFINRRFTFDDALNGTKVLIEFKRQGSPLVSQEEAEARGKTCAACYAALPIPGCSACVAFANYVAEVAGAKKTKADPMLDSKVCAVCLCSAQANIWIPVEVSQAGVTEEMMDLFPKEFCWKRKQILALRQPSS